MTATSPIPEDTEQIIRLLERIAHALEKIAEDAPINRPEYLQLTANADRAHRTYDRVRRRWYRATVDLEDLHINDPKRGMLETRVRALAKEKDAAHEHAQDATRAVLEYEAAR